MAGVFISYRREDAPGHAGRVFDRLRARFGADVVFMDVTAIDAGADFVDAIEQAVGTCDVLLAIIGPQWAAADGAGHRRLDNPHDFVRLEVGGALKRKVRVVPVLVDDARLPVAADLPDNLQPLLRRNAATLRDERWDADIDQLIATVERIVTTPQAARSTAAAAAVPASRHVRTLGAVTVAVIAVVAGAFFGPRACAPASDINVSREVDPPTPNAAATPTGGTPPAVTAAIPDVVGKPLTTARQALRDAGVAVTRVSYVEDRSKPVEQVLIQARARESAAGGAGVMLTVVARVTVVVSHRPEDADVARGLVAHLQGSPAAAGFAVRPRETPAIRPEALAHVTYSDESLASTAADVAKEASSWLRQTDPSRPTLTAAVYRPVVSRTLIIGLPGSGPASSGEATPRASK